MWDNLEDVDNDVGGDRDEDGDNLSDTLLLQKRSHELAVNEEPEPVGEEGVAITGDQAKVWTTLTPSTNYFWH